MKKITLFILPILLFILLIVLTGCSLKTDKNITENSEETIENQSVVKNNTVKNETEITDISNQILTKENYEDISKQYADKENQSDNVIYLTYATIYYIFKDSLALSTDNNLTDEQKKDESYKNIYGKTINSLIEEGKQLMIDNGITVDEYRKTLQESN